MSKRVNVNIPKKLENLLANLEILRPFLLIGLEIKQVICTSSGCIERIPGGGDISRSTRFFPNSGTSGNGIKGQEQNNAMEFICKRS